MSRRSEAIAQLRDRLQEYSGTAGTIARGETELAAGILVVKMDLRRLVRREDEFTIEVDDVAFLISATDLSTDPEPGDDITIGSTVYRVTERREFESCWRWHDTVETQRVVFAKKWGVVS